MAANDNVLDCNTGALTFWEMLGSAIGVQADGKKYLRMHVVTPVAGSSAISCGSGINSPEELMSEMRNLFTLDSNGDVAIRVSQTP